MGIKLYVADNARFTHELEVGDCVLPLQEQFDKAGSFNHYQTEDGRVGILSHQEIRVEVVEEGGYDFTYSLNYVEGGILQQFKTGDIVQLHPACVDKDGFVLQDLQRALVYSTRVPNETLMVRPCDLMLVLSGPSPTGMKSVKELEVRYFVNPEATFIGDLKVGEEVYPVEDGFFQSVKSGDYLCPEEVISVRKDDSHGTVSENAVNIGSLHHGEEVVWDLSKSPITTENEEGLLCLLFCYRSVEKPSRTGYLFDDEIIKPVRVLEETVEPEKPKYRYFVSASAKGIGNLCQGEEICNIKEHDNFLGLSFTATSVDGTSVDGTSVDGNREGSLTTEEIVVVSENKKGVRLYKSDESLTRGEEVVIDLDTPPAVLGDRLAFFYRSVDTGVLCLLYDEEVGPLEEPEEYNPNTTEVVYDVVTKPSHYQVLPEYQVKDINKALLDSVEESGFDMSLDEAGWYQQGMQYFMRFHAKNGIEDLKKGVEAMQIVINSMEARNC